MDIVFKACAIGVIGVLAASMLRRNTPEMSIVVTLAVQFSMAVVAVSIMNVIVDFIRELSTIAGISEEIIVPLLKTVGVSIITKLACDTCRDGGASALASYIELIGGSVAVSFSIPLILAVLDFIAI